MATDMHPRSASTSTTPALQAVLMHYVPRALTQTIRRAMSTVPAVLVTGARQTGKTTLLRTEWGVLPG